MIKVHHLNNSRSLRILRLLEALEPPYEIENCQRDATTRDRQHRVSTRPRSWRRG